jgi:hypothetical protein
MADGQIQVGDTATNPQTGKKLRWDGKAWQPFIGGAPTSNSAWDALKDKYGLPRSIDLSKTLMDNVLAGNVPRGQKINPYQYSRAYEEANPKTPTPTGFFGRAWDEAKNIGSGMFGEGELFGDSGKSSSVAGFAAPDVLGTIQGVKSRAQEFKEHPAAAAGAATTDLAAAALPFVVPDVAGKVKNVAGEASGGLQSMAQEAVVSRSAVEEARVQHEAKLAELQEEYQKKVDQVGRKTVEDEAAYKAKVEQAKDEYARKVAENRQKRIEASAKESAADTRRKTLSQQPRSGPVYQRLSGMAEQAAKSVGELQKSVKASYDARWNAWRQAMGDATGNLEAVQNAVVNAEDNILKGSEENIAIFRNLLKEGEDPLLAQASVFKGGSRGVDVKDVIGSMRSEGERTRFLRSLKDEGVALEGERPGAKAGATLPIDELQGYSTELGDKIYKSRSLPGDVRRALKSVKDAADAEINRVSDAKGQGALYRKLKSDWAEFAGDFYDSDGPLYKLINAVNSDSRISLLSGGEGARVVDSMGHYARFNPDIQLVGRIRSLVKQLREMPTTAKVPGEVPREAKFPNRPNEREMPSKPNERPFSSEKYRREHVQKLANQLHHLTNWEIASVGYVLKELMEGGFPWALSYPVGKRLLAKLLSNPKVVDYLSKELPNAAQKSQ